MFKRIVALIVLGASVALTGCNTMAGMGRDIERGGQKMQEGSRDVQQDMHR